MGEIGVRRTNSREVTAFFLAQAIVVAIHFFIAPMLLTPFYIWLLDAGGEMPAEFATSSVGFMIWVVAFTLFVLLRGSLGGAPPIVAAQGRWDAVTSSIEEVVSYVSAVLIVMLAVWILSAVLSPAAHMALRKGGYMALAWPVWFALSAASAVAAFLMFVALRGVAPAVAIPEVFD